MIMWSVKFDAWNGSIVERDSLVSMENSKSDERSERIAVFMKPSISISIECLHGIDQVSICTQSH
jgi:hypothetical protein